MLSDTASEKCDTLLEDEAFPLTIMLQALIGGQIAIQQISGVGVLGLRVGAIGSLD
jgi:hypothetical protein